MSMTGLSLVDPRTLIGTGKLDYIAITRSPEELALMRSIKRSLDPKNILNPGKILPATA